MWFPTRSDINRPVQSQKRGRILKFRIKVEEDLYYPSSENKGADQLRSYCEADLRLCFRLGRLLVFPCSGSFMSDFFIIRVRIEIILLYGELSLIKSSCCWADATFNSLRLRRREFIHRNLRSHILR